MRADRLLEIILLLQARGRMTAASLAQELEVSERTIYRDLDSLSAAGIPVYAEGGPGGGCSLPEHYRTLLTGVSTADVGAVLMAATPGPLADLGLDKSLQAALHKLVAALPASQRQAAAQARHRLHLDAAMWFQRAESVPFLALLQEAVWQDRCVKVRYRRSDGQERDRLLAPYSLAAKANIWYVVGQVEGSMRVYRVSRILEATLTDRPFTRPADFDLAAYWTGWVARYESSMPCYLATLSASPDLLEALRERFHTTLIENTDCPVPKPGWTTVTVTFETMEGAARWILGCGPSIAVVGPPELRESVLRQAADIVSLYQVQEEARLALIGAYS